MSSFPTTLAPAPPATTVASAPPRRLSVRNNFLWVLAGNTTYAASQWIMLILLTKLCAPEVVGQFSLGLALTAPIILLANMQLRSVQATDATGRYSFADYFTVRTVAVIIALAMIASIAHFGGYHASFSQVILALGLARAAECFSEVFIASFQRHERMDLVSYSLLLKSTLSLLAFGTVIYFTRSLVAAVWSLGAAWAAVLFLFDLPLGRRFAVQNGDHRWFSPLSHWRSLAWMALPLGVASMLKTFEMSVPRYFIERHWGERELGLFAASASLTLIGIQVITALGQSATPRLADLQARGERKRFVALAVKLLTAGLTVGLAGLTVTFLLGRELLGLLYTADYAAHYAILLWIMAAAALGYLHSLLGTCLNALRVFRFRFPVHVVALTLLGAGCLYLGPSHGLRGITWAIGLTEAFTLVAYATVLSWALRRPAAPPRERRSAPASTVSAVASCPPASS
jgi:O-antigen/teichoic acid export membrane protein